MTMRGMTKAMALVLTLLAGSPALAATLNSPLAAGDVFLVANALNKLDQVRPGTVVTGITMPVAKQLSGVWAGAGSVYYVTGDTTATSPEPLAVHTFSLGQTSSTQVLGGADFTGRTGQIRDVSVDAAGNIYTVYTNATVDKFTNTGGSYTRSALGTFTALSFGDNANGHLGMSNDGKFLITSSRGENDLWSMNTTTGAVLNVDMGATGSGIVSEAVVDPIAGNRILFATASGTNINRLWETTFDPVTGAIGSSVTALTLANVTSIIDSLAFDPANGDLYYATRNAGGQIRKIDYATLTAARGGTLFDQNTAGTLILQNGDANVARDLAFVSPSAIPTPAALPMGVALLAGLATRRTRR
jgi:hypothetical protein